MGILAQGFGGSAAQTAQGSLAWGGLGTGIGAVGGLLSGLGGYQEAMYRARVAQNNAVILQQNAAAAQMAGQYEGSASLMRTGKLVGQEKAAQAANGVDVNVGSPAAVRAGTQEIGAMDAAMIHYNAQRQAFAEQTEAAAEKAQARADEAGAVGNLALGGFKAATTLIGGATSLGSKWAQQQLSFGG